MPDNGGNPGDSRPTPDPTVMSTEAIDRATKALSEITEAKLMILEERLRGIDKATVVLKENATKAEIAGPQAVVKDVSHLRELTDEKFESVQTQFKERDTRSERESRDNKVAVDAAFAAQKEAAAEQNKANTLAIDKSERATAETIKSVAGSVDDLKGRLTIIESTKVGASEATTGQRSTIGILTGVAVLGVTLLLGVATIIVALLTR